MCVINKAMAEKYWPDKDPIGQLIVLTRNDVNGEKKPRRIVGVVADVRGRINEDPPPGVYVPYAQMAFFNMQCWSTRATPLLPSARLCPLCCRHRS